MFKHLFDNAQSMAGFPVFSLMVFIAFFVLMTLWILTVDKKHVEEMSHLPLDENEEEKFNVKS
jgi:cytochrome c oxidase cbb3-type subunit IV